MQKAFCIDFLYHYSTFFKDRCLKLINSFWNVRKKSKDTACFLSAEEFYITQGVMKCLVWWEDGNQFRREISYPARFWIQLRHTAVHTWYSDFKCTSGYLWLDFCFPAHIWFYLSKGGKKQQHSTADKQKTVLSPAAGEEGCVGNMHIKTWRLHPGVVCMTRERCFCSLR